MPLVKHDYPVLEYDTASKAVFQPGNGKKCFPAIGSIRKTVSVPAVMSAGTQAVEKVEHSWAFSHLYGKISMGDERCLNEGSWIVES